METTEIPTEILPRTRLQRVKKYTEEEQKERNREKKRQWNREHREYFQQYYKKRCEEDPTYRNGYLERNHKCLAKKGKEPKERIPFSRCKWAQKEPTLEIPETDSLESVPQITE